MPNPQLSWRTDDFLSGLSPLADQSQFWSVRNSLFALTWLSRINVAQEPWRGHACIGLSRDIRHYSSFISMLLSARCTPSRPSYSFGSKCWLQQSELKRLDPDSMGNGRAASALLSAITRNDMSEEWRSLIDSKFSRVRWTVIYALQSLLFYAILAALLVLLLIYFQICTSVSNKSTNQIQQFLKLITWRLLVCTAQHVSDVLTSIIRSSRAAIAASGFTAGAWW